MNRNFVGNRLAVMAMGWVVAGVLASGTPALGIMMMETHGPVQGSGNDAFMPNPFTGLGTGNLDVNIDIMLPQFNPAMGTLQQVDVTFNLVSDATTSSISNTLDPNPTLTSETPGLQADTDSDSDFDVQYGTSSSTTVSAPGQIGSAWVAFTFPPEVTLGQGDSVPDPISGPIPFAFATYGAGDITPYIGTGEVMASVDYSSSLTIHSIMPADNPDLVGLSTESTFDPNMYIQSMGSTDITVSASVKYTYETFPEATVPEPITATLGLMGLGVLGAATRRRTA